MPTGVQNFDKVNGGKWFRILSKVPDRHGEITEFAKEFIEWVVFRLAMKPSIPIHGFDVIHLHWIEPVAMIEARKIWEASPCSETPLPWTDIEVRSSIALLPCREGEIVVGCTPLCSKGNILIQQGLAQYCTFRAIADECYHVFQDYSRTCEWRRLNYEFAEEEAATFADSLAVHIRRFLELRSCFHK